jgi:hypothetical protein
LELRVLYTPTFLWIVLVDVSPSLGLDNMLRPLLLIDEVSNAKLEDVFGESYQLGCPKGKPYVIACVPEKLEKVIESDKMHKGITRSRRFWRFNKAGFAFEYSRRKL